MKIALVARDGAPSRALHALGGALKSKGHDASAFLHVGHKGNNWVDFFWDDNENGQKVRGTVESAELLVVGMSCESNAGEELGAIKMAVAKGAPVILYAADNWDVVNRPWFNWVRPKAVFVMNEGEAKKARGLFSTDTEVLVTGNMDWEEYFQPPEPSRDEWRTKWGVKQPLVLNIWGTDPVRNIAIASALVDANKDDQWDLRVWKHPSDDTPDEVYHSLTKYGHISWTKDILVPYADVVVECISREGIEAGCRRIPVVSVFPEVAKRRLEEMAGKAGWGLCETGSSMYETPLTVGEAVEHLLKYHEDQRERQELTFPHMEEHQAIDRMVAYIESIVK